MIIFPAVDIQDGHAVRLKRGRQNESTIFAEDPLDVAKQWRDKGASWLHIVDLDGAFAGRAVSAPLVQRICQEIRLPIQIGGGIRNLETAKTYLQAGAARLIIGTIALEDPDLFARLCNEFPGRIGVSLDAEKGILKSRGWTSDSGHKVGEILPRLEEAGAAFLIYTDIERDGMRSGVNLASMRELAESAHIPVIAAGGIASIEDIQALYPLSKSSRLVGAITGRALYEGSLDLEEALAWIATQE